MSKPGTLPEVENRQPTGTGGWLVTVFNNDHNTYEEVIHILQVATGCNADEAYMETWEVDHLGSSVVHQAAREECGRVSGVIATIGIRVEVSEA
jgi:hypothetical protein